jgi:hypothetical protein
MKRFVGLMVLMMLVLFAAVAMAGGDIAGAAEPGAVGQFVDGTLQPLLLSLFGTVVTTAVTYLSLLLKRKWGLEIGAETQRRIGAVAFDAVHVVEEQAAAYAKEKGEKWLSANKHQAAVSFMLAKVPSLTKDEADEKVTAALAMIKGLGATNTRVGG